jgi:hypothetical protein
MDLVKKIQKGDRFYKGTSPTVYTALTDESARGWITATAWNISVATKFRVNSNHDPLTIIKEEVPEVVEEPSYMMFARANVRGGAMTSPRIVEALLARIDRLEKDGTK